MVYYALQFICIFVLDFLQFSKALNRFQKEDPTFRVGLDPESAQVCFGKMFTCTVSLIMH